VTKPKKTVVVEEMATRHNEETGMTVSLVRDPRANPSLLVYVSKGAQKLLMWWGTDETEARAVHNKLSAKWCRL
jgi:hypothetical protein